MLGCKRKRVVLSIQQKLEIINQLEKRGVVKQTVRYLKNQKNQLI
jgi:hypothetical protein